MKKNKFIYILSKTRDCVEELYGLDEIVATASTDIQKILNNVSYSRSYYSTIWVVKNGDCDLREISLEEGAETLFRKYLPTIYDVVLDKEEIDYVDMCLTKWSKRRNNYLEKVRIELENERREHEETMERMEYERLKKKFEN